MGSECREKLLLENGDGSEFLKKEVALFAEDHFHLLFFIY